MAQSNYFEDFEVGSRQEFGSYLVTEEEIIEFATKYDPQPFHLSDEAGKAMIFGGLCASGWHTGSIAMRMTVDNMPADSASLGAPGLDELRWVKPVFPGDRLRMASTVVSTKESNSRPELGIVFLLNEVFNQKDELVMSFKPTVMFRKRAA
ncbi:MAG: MaoC family dehydratase [Pseudohongiellaceae bacterium]